MRKIWKIVIVIFILSLTLIILFPVAMTICGSFGVTLNEITIDISGYVDFWIWKPLYFKAFLRSLFIAILTTVGNLIISVPASYFFAKISFPGKTILFMLYIILMVMPFQVTLLPQYIAAKSLHIHDTLFSLIMPGIFATFSVFLITQNMKTMSDDIIEAASLDTSNPLKIIYHVIIPSVRPGIICSAILIFSEMWSQVAEPLVMIESEDKYPLAVLLNSNITFNLYELASIVVFLLPPVLLFLIFNDDVLEGMSKYNLK